MDSGVTTAFAYRKANHWTNSRPLGVTLIELLAICAIISIVAGLALVGIQAARQAAWRAECAQHMTQVGMALALYDSSFRMFPPAANQYGSFHVALLPFLEQQIVYDQARICHERGIDNRDFNLPRLAVFECPADVSSSVPRLAGTNYVGCTGTWVHSDGWNDVIRYWQKAAGHSGGPVRRSDVSDGLSNTLALGEMLRANGSFDLGRVNWGLYNYYTEIDRLAAACNDLPPSPYSVGFRGDNHSKGTPWWDPSIGTTLYNHVCRPNRVSCYNGTSVLSAAASSGSMHNDGVNSLFADGHIEFIVNTIQLDVWRKLASREGGS